MSQEEQSFERYEPFTTPLQRHSSTKRKGSLLSEGVSLFDESSTSFVDAPSYESSPSYVSAQSNVSGLGLDTDSLSFSFNSLSLERRFPDIWNQSEIVGGEDEGLTRHMSLNLARKPARLGISAEEELESSLKRSASLSYARSKGAARAGAPRASANPWSPTLVEQESFLRHSRSKSITKSPSGGAGGVAPPTLFGSPSKSRFPFAAGAVSAAGAAGPAEYLPISPEGLSVSPGTVGHAAAGGASIDGPRKLLPPIQTSADFLNASPNYRGAASAAPLYQPHLPPSSATTSTPSDSAEYDDSGSRSAYPVLDGSEWRRQHGSLGDGNSSRRRALSHVSPNSGSASALQEMELQLQQQTDEMERHRAESSDNAHLLLLLKEQMRQSAQVMDQLKAQNEHIQQLQLQQQQIRAAPVKNDSPLSPPVDITTLIQQKGYNPPAFNLTPPNARFFVIKSYTEEDVHKSLKYEIWASTDLGNKRLDTAFRESADKGPIYLFFSVNGSGHFAGMAQMLTPVDYSMSSNVWASDKWKGVLKVRWIYIKDVPLAALRHIHLSNTQDHKPVTSSRDTQEVPYDEGCQVLRILHQYNSRTSLLQDFHFYEKRSLAGQSDSTGHHYAKTQQARRSNSMTQRNPSVSPGRAVRHYNSPPAPLPPRSTQQGYGTTQPGFAATQQGYPTSQQGYAASQQGYGAFHPQQPYYIHPEASSAYPYHYSHPTATASPTPPPLPQYSYDASNSLPRGNGVSYAANVNAPAFVPAAAGISDSTKPAQPYAFGLGYTNY